MELPLTPLEFARRTRKLYPQREAVVDGNLRLTMRSFFSVVIVGPVLCDHSE